MRRHLQQSVSAQCPHIDRERPASQISPAGIEYRERPSFDWQDRERYQRCARGDLRMQHGFQIVTAKQEVKFQAMVR